MRHYGRKHENQIQGVPKKVLFRNVAVFLHRGV